MDQKSIVGKCERRKAQAAGSRDLLSPFGEQAVNLRVNPRVLEHVTRGIGLEHCFDNRVLNAGVLGIVALVVIDGEDSLGFGSPQELLQ